MEEIKKGGKRIGAGRKPTSDPKIPITIYVETSIVDRHETIENFKGFLYGLIKGQNKPIVATDSQNRINTKEIRETAKKWHKNTSGGIVQDFNVPPKSNYSIDTRTKEEIEQRIKELTTEMKSPPKNPFIGLKKWMAIREQELKELKSLC